METRIMKKKLVITFLAVTAFAVGCKPAGEKSSAQIDLDTASDKVEAKTKESAQATKELAAAKKEYAYTQKAEFVTEKQTELTGINRELEALSAKVEAASEAVKAEAKPKLQALREQAVRLGEQLDKAKAASEPAWDSVKAGSSKAYDDLKEGFMHARQWASEKIAP
jgi:chromosome segregation ATPase